MADASGRGARGAPLVGRRRADPARAGRARAGAAEPRLRRLPAAARRGDRRLGRRLAGHGRPRQPRGAVARGRAAARGVRGRAGSSSRPACRSTPSTSPSSTAGSTRRSRPRVRRAADALGLAREDAGRPASRATVPVPRRRDALPLELVGDELGEEELVRLLRGARERARARLRRRRPAAPRGVRRRGHLRRDAEHPVHERLLLPLRLLRVLEGQARREPARAGVPRAERGDRAARARRRGSAARPRCACRAGSTRRSRATTTPTSSTAIQAAVPGIHVHAFSALEVWQGAATLGLDLETYLARLRDLGLGSLPGTAAEILDDEVRAVICPDKVTTDQWLEVHDAAHRVGLRSNVTIMFGHVERPVHWARHLLRAREQQARIGGFTEFVPLPFVPMEAPIYLQGRARRGPTFGEALLVHAVARLALHPLITNIQASWVKLGPDGVRQALAAGVNDLGGTLMNESISRAAGSEWGQELPPEQMEALIRSAGRVPRQRTTTYGAPPEEQVAALVRRRAARRAGQPAGARRRAEASRPARAAGPRCVASAVAPTPASSASGRHRRTAPGAGTPAARVRERRSRRRRGRIRPVEPLAVPDEQVLGLERARAARAAARGAAARCTPARSSPAAEEGVRADRLGDDERPLARATRGRPRASWLRARRRRPRTACPGARPASRGAARRARPRARRSRGCDGRGAGAPPAGSPSARARRAPARVAPGSTSQTRPSAASACDVRVIGSSTSHENPSSPRSSQKRISTMRAYASSPPARSQRVLDTPPTSPRGTPVSLVQR